MTIAIEGYEEWLRGLRLDHGMHFSPAEGMCLLEAAAYLAGEEHSDHPKCVSPVLGQVGRILNDTLRPNDRQRLKVHLPQMLGTAADGLDETRTALVFDWTLRTHAPRWLRYAQVSDVATLLQGLPPIHDLGALRSLEGLIAELEQQVRVRTDEGRLFDVALATLAHAMDSAHTLAQAKRNGLALRHLLTDMAGDAIPTFGHDARIVHYDAVADTERDLVDLYARLIRPVVPPRIEG